MADWMMYLNKDGWVEVKCSECGYHIPPEDDIPDECPKCGVWMESSNERVECKKN